MLSDLNDEQKQAVLHTGSPLLISAGPGSGKTRVLVERIVNMLQKGTNPSEILCLTFSEKAANELKQRLEEHPEIKGKIDIVEMNVSTFHSFCRNILLDNTLRTGFGMRGGIVDRSAFLVWGMKNIDNFGFDDNLEIGSNVADVINKMLQGVQVFNAELIGPDELEQYVKDQQGKISLVSDIEKAEYLKLLHNLIKIYRAYNDIKRKADIMDYDDLVVEANKFLLNPENEYLKKNYQSKYKQILIDEFQDNNFAQFSILKNIANDGNVTAVGDDDQNIYRFQGAYAQIFDDFRITFPNHTEIILSRNYRNPPHVINFSGQLLEQDKYRKPKPITAEKNDTNKVEVIECNSELSQAEYVKKYIQDSMKKNPSYKFKDFAILSRKQKDGLRTAQLLVSEGIPVNYKGKTSINSSVSSKVIFSFLRVIADPMNSITSIVRILQEYGITEQNISKINFEAKKRSRGKPDGDYVFDVLSDLQVPNITQTNELKEIFKMINEFINLAKNSTISETVYQIARNKTSIYKKIANDDSIENFIERSTIDNIINTTSDFEKIFPNGTMKDFLDFIDELDDLDIETKTNSVDLDAVNVSTIHGSKGLEFKVVFIVDVAPFKIPLRFTEKPFYVPTELVKGQRPPAEPKVEFEREERRVFYVGMTRAIDRLIISYPTKYENRETSNRASRFLLELKPQKNAQVDFQNFNFSRAIQKYVGFNAVDILKNEIIQEAKNHIDSSNFSSAIQKIIDLANISHFVNNKTSSGFEIDPLVPKTVSPEIQTKLQGKYEKLGFTGVNLSFTKIDQYHDCPKKFWYENVISALPNSPQSQLYKGSIFHEIVEESAQRKAQGVQDDLSKLKSELVTKWSNTAYLALPIKKEEEDKKSLEPALESYIKWANSNSNEIVEVEHEFNIDVAGFPVKGKIDRIEKTKNGDYIIIDYKTGGKNKRVDDPATSLQLNIYCLAVKKRFGVLPKQAIFFYVEKPDGEQFFVYDVDEAKVNSALTELETYVKDIMDKKFDAKPSYQICKWCSFNDICDDANKKEQKN